MLTPPQVNLAAPDLAGLHFIRLSILLIIHRGLITLCALALLVPIGLLFLCELTKTQSFGIVVGFTVIFSLAITLSQETDMHKALYAVCGFSAVLVTVMVQLVGTTPV